MTITYKEFVYSNDVFAKPQSFINDWYDLSAVLNIPAYKISYTLKNKDELQKKIIIQDRVVYDSAPVLRQQQQRISLLLNSMYSLVDTEHMLAYVPKKDYKEVLKETTKYSYMVTFDIKKYYDHVTFEHITNTLTDLGFTKLGAKLIARLATVNRVVTKKNGEKIKISTLQQGSVCSPVISNLVGYKYIDKPIKDWLEANTPDNVEVKYYRYSDNVALFFRGLNDKQVSLNFIKQYKDFVYGVMRNSKFRAHKWSTRANNNPRVNQKWLGIVLNHTPRIELEDYKKLRSVLFNMCINGVDKNIEEYAKLKNIVVPENALGDRMEWLTVKVMQRLGGEVAYLKSINAEHYMQLNKLFKAVKIIKDNSHIVYKKDGTVYKRILNAIKLYKKSSESLEAYLERLTKVVRQIQYMYKSAV